ncbi:Flp pilus assembly complex ATPase component TadA [Candidatus Parcubacteria bacterium]|jgi:twitching motility protein PilT|nr:Flp pilus assembly complex ATPase component TadA [Candidatus Parcubacteria bacterium]
MSDTLLINNILNSASERKATDVHLVAGSPPVVRVDSRLITLTDQQVLTPDIVGSIVESFLSKKDAETLNEEREVSTIYSWAGRSRYRAKVFYQKGFLAISLRLVPAYIRSPKELSLPPAVIQLLNKDKGLLIITGPFNSGRTTTATSLLETLNQNKGLHIQTLENPIEFLFSNNQSVIEQREVGRDTPSYKKGIEDAVDQDVDVVFVGSLHEDGQEELVLELAESGKLVIVVMDANSVVSAIERFISNISEDRREWGRDLFSEILIGIIAQRLLPRSGGGMSLAAEILTMTPAVSSSIKDNKLNQLPSIMQTSKDEGMMNLDKSLMELTRVGEVSPADAMQQAINPQIFKQNIS